MFKWLGRLFKRNNKTKPVEPTGFIGAIKTTVTARNLDKYNTLMDPTASFIVKAEAFKAVRHELNVPEHIGYMTKQEAALHSQGAAQLQKFQERGLMPNNIARIAVAVEQFVRERVGQEFTANEMRSYVANLVPSAPGSPDRVMRKLRAEYKINYVLVDRMKSLYRAIPVEGPPKVSVPGEVS